MVTQPIEIITGQELVERLQTLIDSHRIIKMEILQTRFSWITMILSIEKQDNSDFLLVDPVARFESIHSRFPTREVSFEYLEKGVLCKFSSRVIRCHRRAIWLEFPKSIQRIQRRAYFRIDSSPGAEIIFRVAGKEEKGRVKDYSLGGASFFLENHLKLKKDDELTDLILTLPQGKAMVSYPIPLAVVRRVDEHFEDRRRLCGLEFLKLEGMTREELSRHIFEEQRILIQRIRKI
jgi:c-di-GMP-binding flagellar brake protein YcgR